jgi:hypothetical protein
LNTIRYSLYAEAIKRTGFHEHLDKIRIANICDSYWHLVGDELPPSDMAAACFTFGYVRSGCIGSQNHENRTFIPLGIGAVHLPTKQVSRR